MVRPQVHSEKHYVQFSLDTTASGVAESKTPISAVAIVDKNAVGEVREGCIIKAIYIDFWVSADSTTPSTAIVAVEKISGDMTGLQAGTIAALGLYTNKKNVFQVFQGLLPASGANPIPALRGWIKIPKSKQRFGLGDKLTINIFSQTEALESCGFAVYKEYF